jgi:hypothetical protein
VWLARLHEVLTITQVDLDGVLAEKNYFLCGTSPVAHTRGRSMVCSGSISRIFVAGTLHGVDLARHFSPYSY